VNHMSRWKSCIVVLVMVLLAVSSALFIITGYSALYRAWLHGDLRAALPYLSWARVFGVLATAGAAAALGILFSSDTFPIGSNVRLGMSVLATVTIGLFSEFRNEGKFCFKNLHHFFAPGSWIHDDAFQQER
jgi:hypothetical protein